MRAIPFALAILSGTLHFLSFSGFGVWQLAFVCFLPLFAAFDHHTVRTYKRAAAIGLTHGFVAYAGGYHWLVKMLEVFSGYGPVPSAGIAAIFFLYLGLLQVVVALLYRRAQQRGHNGPVAAVAIIVAVEYGFPTLFPSHLAYAFFDHPWLIQTADLGGPSLVSAVPLVVQAALYRSVVTLDVSRTRALGIAVVVLAAHTAYGAYRTHEVDLRIADAREAGRTWHVGVVQVSMDVFEKHRDPWGGYQKHLRSSLELEARFAESDPLDLIVWPESAYVFFVNDRTDFRRSVMRQLHTPLLFGAVRRDRTGVGRPRDYNSAYLLNADAEVQGRTEKVHLLAFGEYLPLGETFPSLYELSPHTGRLTPGNAPTTLELDGQRITTLICYEDVLPRFTRLAVRDGSPNIMVNLTNDAWFGKSQEPHIHLAMARFRAAEHHVALVRSTNSGVSAFIDPAGRVMSSGGLFTDEQLTEHVPLMQGTTLYATLGDWPAWLALLLTLYFVVRQRSAAPPPSREGA